MEPRAAAVPVPPQRQAVDITVLVRRTHDLLAAGVPLTLLLDLGDEAGPRSHQRYATEVATRCAPASALRRPC